MLTALLLAAIARYDVGMSREAIRIDALSALPAVSSRRSRCSGVDNRRLRDRRLIKWTIELLLRLGVAVFDDRSWCSPKSPTAQRSRTGDGP
jgi:hypothetical protein